ncbi:MAG: hypothetical protein RMM58_09345 [Chloroflexota bacterium]|nr:hypothetical protein [Dehalococcoidia bacterium]MDW8254071.1 hypothetical protein [Chloroflexota bacterium]
MIAVVARELGVIAASWPLAFGLLVIVVELARGRADLRLIGSALLLGLLFSASGAVIGDVGTTLRRVRARSRADWVAAWTTDLAAIVVAVAVMALTPWNTLPALALAGSALFLGVATLPLALRPRRARDTLLVMSAIALLALCGGIVIGAGTLAAVARAGPSVVSTDLPKPPSR